MSFEGTLLYHRKIFTMLPKSLLIWKLCYKYNFKVVLIVIASVCWSQNGHFQMLPKLQKIMRCMLHCPFLFLFNRRSENFQLVQCDPTSKIVSSKFKIIYTQVCFIPMLTVFIFSSTFKKLNFQYHEYHATS